MNRRWAGALSGLTAAAIWGGMYVVSDVVLDVGVKKEACPLGLAPMASTTVTLVMGDALAACLIVRKGFRKEDFAFYHPGGALGRQLLLKAVGKTTAGGIRSAAAGTQAMRRSTDIIGDVYRTSQQLNLFRRAAGGSADAEPLRPPEPISYHVGRGKKRKRVSEIIPGAGEQMTGDVAWMGPLLPEGGISLAMLGRNESKIPKTTYKKLTSAYSILSDADFLDAEKSIVRLEKLFKEFGGGPQRATFGIDTSLAVKEMKFLEKLVKDVRYLLERPVAVKALTKLYGEDAITKLKNFEMAYAKFVPSSMHSRGSPT